jgi:hypothetical protein
MQTINFWHSKHIYRRQVISLLILLCTVRFASFAQTDLNLAEHDDKRYYFGITLSGNSAGFQLQHHPTFLSKDSVSIVSPASKGGFGLGLLGSFRISQHLEARFNPHLIFATRAIQYQLKYPRVGEEQNQEKLIESIYTSFPVQLKFSSDRIGNFRVYILGGGKYDYDLASNSQRRQAEDLVKLVKGSFGYEAGFGFNFYFPSFIFSPEIKISNTLRNVHARDPNLIYSNVIDRMQGRMIVFSIHLEG